MGKAPPKWLPGERVKETILLQRKSVEQLRADRILRKDKLKERRDRHKAKLDAKRKRKLETKKFVTAQTLLKHALRKEKQGRTFRKIGERAEGRKRRSKRENYNKYLRDSQITLVVRAKGKQIPPEVAAAFRELGLEKIYSARLICADARSHTLLKQLAPFSIIGHPDRAQMEQLLRTRGALYDNDTNKNDSKKYISGNLMLEQALGVYGVLCIEDLVETIVQKTEHVQDVLQRLAPFDFHPPRQLFMERHRSVHAKLEQVNTESFAAYLEQQLRQTARKSRRQSANERQNKNEQDSKVANNDDNKDT